MAGNSEIIKQVAATFDEKLAISLLGSSDPFPVDFDAAWQWIGYTRKDVAKRQLSKFKKDIDYSTSKWNRGQGARSSEIIKLSVDCFKHLAMLAQTEQGWTVRNYFIECEHRAKSVLFHQGKYKSLPQAPSLIDSKIQAARKEEEKLLLEIAVLYKRHKDVKVMLSRLWIEKHQSIIDEYPKHKAIVDQSNPSNDGDIPRIDFTSWELD